MNLFTDELQDWDEPHTPRWLYHCREHTDHDLMKYNDPHFQTGHAGKDPNRLRVRCQGMLCIHCVTVPVFEQDNALSQDKIPQESAPNDNQPDESQTENDSPSEDESLEAEDEHIS